jgi:hypothetical protein
MMSYNEVKNEVNGMSLTRETLHHIIDQLPEHKLPDIEEWLSRIYEEEQVSMSKTELKEIEQARQRIKNGEYAKFDEVFGDLDV